MRTDKEKAGATVVPKAFQTIFRELVIALQPPRALDRDAPRIYYETLGAFPMEVLEQSAINLRRTQKFFPSTSEWFQAAEDVLRQQRTEGRRTTCNRCAGQGLIRVAYHTGEPFDVAICNCSVGEAYRDAGEAFIRARLGLGPENRVADLDAFEEE